MLFTYARGVRASEVRCKTRNPSARLDGGKEGLWEEKGID